MRTAVFHDYFDKKGGGEKLALVLAEVLDADLFTGFVGPDTYEMPAGVTEISSRARKPLHLHRLSRDFAKLNVSGDYDVFVLSGTICTAAARRHHPNIWYCHTPPRYMYDLKERIYEDSGLATKVGMKLFGERLRREFEANLKHVDHTITNSENIRNRLRKFCSLDSEVVYPPVDVDGFRWTGQEDFYLSTGRIDKLKRIDVIVDAFRNTDKKLVVMSGGPELEKIRKTAAGRDNVRVAGWVGDDEMKDLIGKCIATIYIPVDEDFGMSPVESMAAGKPCIGVNEGGLRETIVHKKTGYLCKSATPDQVREAVRWMTPEQAKKLRKECERRAEKFSKKRFVESMRKAVKAAAG